MLFSTPKTNPVRILMISMNKQPELSFIDYL